ncbi:MAG: hypothetical protein ACI4HO_06530 [Ruminococcus sp.]
MKYCTKCRRLYNDEDTECKECKKGKLETITDESTPVYLCSGDVMERDRVQAALKDSKIPSDYKRNMVSANSQVVTGMDFDGFDILVPFDMYEQAFDVAVGIGAIKLNEEEMLAYKLDKNDGIEEFEEMSSSKRTTVRIISAILIIIAFAAIIYGVDFIMALIKNLFT